MAEFLPTDEQRQVLDTAESALVTAGPGTGKTRTAIEKAIIAAAQFPENCCDQVLFLSFSNVSVRRLADAARIHVPVRRKGRLRFMTYHALAADLLQHFGRFVSLPPRIRVMDRLEEMLVALEEGWIDANNYEERLLATARAKGLISFTTMVPLATRLLRSSPPLSRIICRRYPLIIVDEFQDTSRPQWELLQAVGANSQVLTFGDPNQIIYSSLHQATEARLDEFRLWKGGTEIKFSERNFRCGSPEILTFADCVLKGAAYTFRERSGVQPLRAAHRNELRAKLAVLWMSIRKKAGDKATIAFLTPNNRIADEVATELRNPPESAQVAFPVFARMNRDDAAHDSVLLALSALKDIARHSEDRFINRAAVALQAMDSLWNTRKKVTSASVAKIAKALRQDLATKGPLHTVMVTPTDGKVLNSLLSRFVDALASTTEFQVTAKRIKAHDRVRCEDFNVDDGATLFDSLRANRQPKGLYGESYDAARTCVLNYHKAKGREFDYVVIVVDPRGETSKTPLDEARRLMYVCVTRAKRWLGILHFGSETGRVLGPVIG